jgi:hypothetical protein
METVRLSGLSYYHSLGLYLEASFLEFCKTSISQQLDAKAFSHGP